MNKSDKKMEKRAKYVKERIKESNNATREIRKLSQELFLSERTIERDLKK